MRDCTEGTFYTNFHQNINGGASPWSPFGSYDTAKFL